MSDMDRQETKELIAALKNTLPVKEVRFFGNLARLSTILKLVGKYADQSDSRILDLACGAFALDFLLESKGYQNITAIDKNPRLVDTYGELQSQGLLKNTVFFNRDINTISIRETSQSLIVLNDGLFYGDLDLAHLLPEVRSLLSGGGYFIFDVWRSEFYDRFGRVYDRLYPRYRAFKRYSFAEVTENLDKYGFSVEEIVPWFSYRRHTGLVQRLVWSVFHLANTTYFVAKRKSS